MEKSIPADQFIPSMLHDEKEEQAEGSDSKNCSDQPADYEAGNLQMQFESKATIIDKELNQHGMGRYQWFMWAICGTGFCLDVMWAVSFSYAAPNIQREFGYSDKEYGNLFSCFYAGMMVGAVVWGGLVDVIGRRTAFLGTTLVAGIFGTCLGAVSSYSSILVLVTFTSIGIGGNIPVDSTIAVEYLPEDRFYLLSALSLFQPTGVMTCTLLAYGFIPNYSCEIGLTACHLVSLGAPCCSRGSNMGWRYMFFALGAITLSIFVLRFFIFPFYETPKFLLTKGNDEGAVDVVRKIAAFNKRPCNLTIEALREMVSEASSNPAPKKTWNQRIYAEVIRHKLLFSNRRAIRITILVCLTWMFDYWGFGISGSFLAAILQRKNAAIHISLRQTYKDYLIIYCPGILAVFLAIFMVQVPALGRKWTLVLSSIFMGVSLFLYSIVNSEVNRVGFNAMYYFFLTLFNSVLFGWTPEAFPAAVRGTATGLASFFGSLFAITAPLVAEQLFVQANGSNSVIFLAGSGAFVCTICLICIPTKYMVAPRW